MPEYVFFSDAQNVIALRRPFENGQEARAYRDKHFEGMRVAIVLREARAEREQLRLWPET